LERQVLVGMLLGMLLEAQRQVLLQGVEQS